MAKIKKTKQVSFKLEGDKLILINSFFPFTGKGKIEVEMGQNCIVKDFSISRKSDKNYLIPSELSVKLFLKITQNTFQMGIENHGAKPLYIKSLKIIFAPEEISPLLPVSDYLQLVNSRSISQISGVRPVGKRTLWSDGIEPSYLVTVLYNKNNGKSFLMGALPGSPAFTYFEVIHSSPSREENFGFSIGWDMEVEIKPGDRIITAPIVVLTGISGTELLTQYGELCHQQIKNKILPLKTGWNSWDYYAGAVQEKDIKENTLTLKDIFGDKIQYIVIDEGWECKWGIWQPNWKFPEGLKRLCDYTYRQGYIPGIWTAPFLVDCSTPFFREHPEFFASDSNGEVALIPLSYGTMAILDITIPDVIEFLEDIFHYLRDCGFRYFKIDFLECLLQATRFSDRSVGRAQLIREGVSTIRRAIGKDAYLLACGAPFEGVIGLVDAVRVTGDIHNYWAHVKTNCRSFSAKFWMNCKLWRNDPDFLIVRTPQTSDDKWLNRRLVRRPYDELHWWMAGRELNITEVKTYALFVFLSGGDIILGDAITKLNSEGLAILKKVLERPLVSPAIPLDLFNPEGEMPSVYIARERDTAYMGVFNWNDYTKKFSLNLNALNLTHYTRITDFWTGKSVPVSRLNNLELKPMSSAGFLFSQRG